MFLFDAGQIVLQLLIFCLKASHSHQQLLLPLLLLRLLSLLAQHHAVASLCLKLTRELDAARIVTTACTAAIADAILRSRAVDTPSALSEPRHMRQQYSPASPLNDASHGQPSRAQRAKAGGATMAAGASAPSADGSRLRPLPSPPPARASHAAAAATPVRRVRVAGW